MAYSAARNEYRLWHISANNNVSKAGAWDDPSACSHVVVCRSIMFSLCTMQPKSKSIMQHFLPTEQANVIFHMASLSATCSFCMTFSFWRTSSAGLPVRVCLCTLTGDHPSQTPWYLGSYDFLNSYHFSGVPYMLPFIVEYLSHPVCSFCVQ